jgi:hypothetical protein
MRHRTPDAGHRTVTDGDLDRALGSLTDASPSPGLRANVMRRIADEVRKSEVRRSALRQAQGVVSLSNHEGRWPIHVSWKPASAGFRWRLALASAAVILIAASVWLAVRSGPAPQTVTTRAGAHDTALPAASNRSPGERPPTAAQAAPTPDQTTIRTASGAPRPGRSTAAVIRLRHVLGASEAAANEPTEEAAPAIAPIELPPIEEPSPVVIAPVVMNPLEIPGIQIPPVDDRADRGNPPAKTDPDKRPEQRSSSMQ